jgi:hypothetical protein
MGNDSGIKTIGSKVNSLARVGCAEKRSASRSSPAHRILPVTKFRSQLAFRPTWLETIVKNDIIVLHDQKQLIPPKTKDG